MLDVNLSNPIEIRNAGIKALQEAYEALCISESFTKCPKY